MRPATTLAVVAAFLGSFLATGVATAGSAHAHAELASANPAQGSTVDRLPATVELRFTEAVGQPASVAVTGPGGATFTSAGPDVVDKVLTQPLEPGAETPAGAYTVSYRVTSADGHPISGTVQFTVGQSGTSSAAAADVAAGGGASTAATPGVSTGVVAGLVAVLVAALALVVLGLARLVRREPAQ